MDFLVTYLLLSVGAIGGYGIAIISMADKIQRLEEIARKAKRSSKYNEE